MLFWLGFYLFYPVTSSRYSDLHEAEVVKGVMLLLFMLSYLADARAGLYKSRLLRIVTVGWVVWGLLAYLPVLLAWLINGILRSALPEWLGFLLYYSSSGLKAALRIIPSVGLAIMPIVALKNLDDFRALSRAIVVGTAILLTLSFAQSYFGTRFVPSEYDVLPGRMAGFSIPDSNGYGRLLLLPVLLILAGLMDRSNQITVWRWAVALLGISAIALTQSRTTYVSFTVGLGILFLLNLRSLKSFLLTLSVLAAAVVAAIAFGILDAFAPGSERLSTGNLDARLSLLSYLWELVQARPLFGTFPGGYSAGLSQSGFSGVEASAHNMLFGVAVEWGVPMAGILLGALLGAAYYGLVTIARARRFHQGRQVGELAAVSKGVVALSVAYFVHGLTEYIAPDFTFFILGLAIAVCAYLRRHRPTSSGTSITRPRRSSSVQEPRVRRCMIPLVFALPTTLRASVIALPKELDSAESTGNEITGANPIFNLGAIRC